MQVRELPRVGLRKLDMPLRRPLIRTLLGLMLLLAACSKPSASEDCSGLDQATGAAMVSCTAQALAPSGAEFDANLDILCDWDTQEVTASDPALLAGGAVIDEPSGDTSLLWGIGMPVFPAEVVVGFHLSCRDDRGRRWGSDVRAVLQESDLTEIGDEAWLSVESEETEVEGY